MRKLLPLVVALTVLALASPPKVLTGTVVGVADGDTLTMVAGGQQVKVRLAEIDAPEKRQPFGVASKASLSELAFGATVVARVDTVDRYGRSVAHVYRGETDLSAEQVRRGMAWVYRAYARNDSPLLELERQARAARRGLWVDAAPVAPWEFRKQP